MFIRLCRSVAVALQSSDPAEARLMQCHGPKRGARTDDDPARSSRGQRNLPLPPQRMPETTGRAGWQLPRPWSGCSIFSGSRRVPVSPPNLAWQGRVPLLASSRTSRFAPHVALFLSRALAVDTAQVFAHSMRGSLRMKDDREPCQFDHAVRRSIA